MIGLQFIKITPSLLRTLCAIDQFKGQWLALDEHTTALNLIGDVAQHGAQFKKVLEPLQQHDLSLSIIRALHMSVSSHPDRGEFRRDVYGLPFLEDGKEAGVLETADPEDITPLLQKLVDWVNDDLHNSEHHPIFVVAVFAAIFLQISPFAAGNLKLVRLLTVLLLLKSGYSYTGFVNLDPLLETSSARMYQALLSNQQSLENGQPDWQDWLECFADLLLQQSQILADKVDGSTLVEDLDAMPELSLRLLECIKAHKRTTMKQLISFTKGRRATIKLRLQELLQRGMIKRYGAGRGVWYSLS